MVDGERLIIVGFAFFIIYALFSTGGYLLAGVVFILMWIVLWLTKR